MRAGACGATTLPALSRSHVRQLRPRPRPLLRPRTASPGMLLRAQQQSEGGPRGEPAKASPAEVKESATEARNEGKGSSTAARSAAAAGTQEAHQQPPAAVGDEGRTSMSYGSANRPDGAAEDYPVRQRPGTSQAWWGAGLEGEELGTMDETPGDTQPGQGGANAPPAKEGR